VNIYDYSKPFISINDRINKLDHLRSSESRNCRTSINPKIFGSEFYFTEQILRMKKPNQYPYLKYTFDSHNKEDFSKTYDFRSNVRIIN